MAENPDSASNDVWLVAGYCLRMSREPGNSGLFTEAALASMLPPEVGYPRVLATGSEDGHEWILTERLLGHNLWDSWPILTPEQRLAAIDDLWRRCLALQQTEPAYLAGLTLPAHPRYRFNVVEAADQIRLLVEAGIIEERLASSLSALVERGLEAIRRVSWRLVHGDAAFSNAQCHNGRVIGLLDLETACIAPCDADQQPLLRMLANPLDDPGDAPASTPATVRPATGRRAGATPPARRAPATAAA